MTDHAMRFADQAERLEGTPFRLHGRDPNTGLDCVGLVACAMHRAGLPCQVPHGYALRNLDITTLLGCAAASGFIETAAPVSRGDLLLVKPGPAQHHLCIALGTHRIVHAHAGVGRVVVHGWPDTWPVLRCWRLAQT